MKHHTPEPSRRDRAGRFGPFLLVSAFLCTLPVHGEGEPVDNVVIVLDASGSMKEAMPRAGMDKMTAAKQALKQVLAQVPPSTQVGLLVFSAQGLTNDWVYPLGPRDDARLTAAIDRIRPHADTPLGAYIKKGADRLLRQRAEQFGYGTFRMLVVTDGEAQDQRLVDRYTPEVISRGITLDVIGVAMNRAHTLATKVHSYRGANDPAALKRALSEVFAEVGGNAADGGADAESFAAIAPIPEATAAAMIQALATSGNHPIGEKPAPAPTPAAANAPTPSTPAASPSAASTPAPAPTPGVPAPSTPPAPSSGRPGTWLWIVILVIIIASLRRSRKR